MANKRYEPNKRYDFTKERKGSKIPQLGTIDYCPKCGRKGAVKPATLQRGQKFPMEVMHQAHIYTLLGLPCGWASELHGWCFISFDQAPAEHKRMVGPAGNFVPYTEEEPAAE